MNEPSIQRPPQSDELSAIVLEQADRLFLGEATRERLAHADRGEWQSAIWQAVENAGLAHAMVPEAHGGAGLPVADAMRVIRRSAYYTLPVPLAESMMGATLWALCSGQLAEGAVSLAPVNEVDTIAIERSGSGYKLNGRAHRVPWGANVAHVLIYARDRSGSGWLALLAGGSATVERAQNIANEPRDTLLLDATVISPDSVRPAPAGCEEGFLPFGALLRSQQMVGAMERSLDHALDYAAQRRQFGRPIGKFQAVQHMLADAAGQFAAALAAADLSSEAYGSAEFAFAVAVAKARAGEAAGKVAEICHQVHGAMGFTQEHPLHFATRRLWSWRDEFGNELFWQDRIGRAVCSGGGESLWSRLVGH